MSCASHTAREADIVAEQVGRPPRKPWRVAARCSRDYPTAIVSPAVLEDGVRFPSLAWLTCPWLAEACASLESEGATAQWSARAATDERLADALRACDGEVRRVRAFESGGDDACESVGIAGQRDPLGVKCLHAHVALALVGIGDPIGLEVLAGMPAECADARCGAIERRLEERA